MDQHVQHDAPNESQWYAGDEARPGATPERPGPQISYHMDQSIANSDQRTDSGQNVACGQVPEEQVEGDDVDGDQHRGNQQVLVQRAGKLVGLQRDLLKDVADLEQERVGDVGAGRPLCQPPQSSECP